MSPKYVLSLDVGTTTIRAFVYDDKGDVIGIDSDKVQLLYPKPGWVEINPDRLWDSVLKVIRNAIKDAGLTAKDITSMGISTQRATFINWRRSTGAPFHNFITWKDLRADKLVKEWDNSFSMKAIRFGSKILHTVTRQKKYMVGSIMRLQNKMVNIRLLWTLLNIPELNEAIACPNDVQDVLFGTVSTWLVYKMSGEEKLHSIDISNAAATGLYDPFSLEYAPWAFSLFGIPMSIMPLVVDCAGDHFGSTSSELFGAEIPIRSVLADQSASVFGLGCFGPGHMKMTLGSGSFLDVNTGLDVHAGMNGLVPLVGWRVGQDLVYLAEGSDHDTSSLIQWSHQMKLFDNPSDSSTIAETVKVSSGLCFVPAFAGLQAPVNDPTASAGFIGLTPDCGCNEILRAVLESIAFSMKQLLEVMESESSHSLGIETIEIDGGVSKNDFIVQLISTLTGKTIERRTSAEMSAFGAAFMAGLHSDVWSSKEEIHKLKKVQKTFRPNHQERDDWLNLYRKWVKACHRFKNWNTHLDGSPPSS